MINCPNCTHFDGHDCAMFGRQPGMAICPYAVEKEKKPMLDLDALEVGFYAKGRDGNFYRVDLPVDFSFTKTINVLTGEVHYNKEEDK